MILQYHICTVPFSVSVDSSIILEREVSNTKLSNSSVLHVVWTIFMNISGEFGRMDMERVEKVAQRHVSVYERLSDRENAKRRRLLFNVDEESSRVAPSTEMVTSATMTSMTTTTTAAATAIVPITTTTVATEAAAMRVTEAPNCEIVMETLWTGVQRTSVKNKHSNVAPFEKSKLAKAVIDGDIPLLVDLLQLFTLEDNWDVECYVLCSSEDLGDLRKIDLDLNILEVLKNDSAAAAAELSLTPLLPHHLAILNGDIPALRVLRECKNYRMWTAKTTQFDASCFPRWTPLRFANVNVLTFAILHRQFAAAQYLLPSLPMEVVNEMGLIAVPFDTEPLRKMTAWQTCIVMEPERETMISLLRHKHFDPWKQFMTTECEQEQHFSRSFMSLILKDSFDEKDCKQKTLEQCACLEILFRFIEAAASSDCRRPPPHHQYKPHHSPPLLLPHSSSPQAFHHDLCQRLVSSSSSSNQNRQKCKNDNNTNNNINININNRLLHTFSTLHYVLTQEEPTAFDVMKMIPSSTMSPVVVVGRHRVNAVLVPKRKTVAVGRICALHASILTCPHPFPSSFSSPNCSGQLSSSASTVCNGEDVPPSSSSSSSPSSSSSSSLRTKTNDITLASKHNFSLSV